LQRLQRASQKEATMAIDVSLRADEASRTSDRGCKWTARATLSDGRQFEARSRTGAVYELARVLVAAAVGDYSLVVRQASPPLTGQLSYRSFRELAEFTLVEGSTTPLHRARWRDPSSLALRIDAAGRGNAEKGGERGGAGRVVAVEALPPAFAVTSYLDAAE
jgi:hypothetical protein